MTKRPHVREERLFLHPYIEVIMSLVDLHMHSHASDGVLSPEDVVSLCFECGVTMMALTDHDTMRGVPAAMKQASTLGITCVPGVEISTQYAGMSIHIVGIGPELSSQKLDTFLTFSRNLRIERAQKMGMALEALGFKGALEGALRLAGDMENVGRPHFGRWLVNEGHVPSMNQAFRQYLKEGRPAYFSTSWPTIGQAVEAIHDAGGLAVLAHPGRYELKEIWQREALLEEFLKFKGDAIEVTSGSQSASRNPYWHQATLDYKLLASTGSDWHSPTGIRPQPGHQPLLPTDVTPIWSVWQ